MIKKKQGIYKITSPSGRIYIGQSQNIKIRWYDYKRLYNCKLQPKLYRSLEKYGPENHKFEIIEECLLEQLDEREVYWINYYNSIKEGLNIKEGGIGGKHNEETKQKISKALKGKPREEWVKKKISEKIEGRIFKEEWKEKISNAKKGFKYSEESRIKMSNSSKGKKRKFRNRYLSVLQYDLEGNFIKEWENTKKLIEELPYIGYSSLLKVCRGERKHIYKGYKWKWKNL